MSRLNDTKAIADKPSRPMNGLGNNGMESMTVEVRPIDNGYIRRESRYDAEGNYSCRESYSPTRPSTNESKREAGSLKAAADYLRK